MLHSPAATGHDLLERGLSLKHDALVGWHCSGHSYDVQVYVPNELVGVDSVHQHQHRKFKIFTTIMSAYKVLKTMAQRSMAMFVAVLPLIIRVECDDGPTSCGPTNACCPTKDPLGMAEYEIIW